jgi:hypothetical protein
MELVLQDPIAASGRFARINNQLVPSAGNLSCDAFCRSNGSAGTKAKRTAITIRRAPDPWPTIRVQGQPAVQVDAQKAARHLTDR